MIIAAITALVPAANLGLPPWKWIILSCAVLAVAATIIWIFRQSREDHELGKKLDDLMAARGMSPDTPRSPLQLSPLVAEASPEEPPTIDGEVYRIALSPRSMSWELVRDIYRMQGRPQDARIDCDVLLELYLVNRSKNESRYVRDLRLSAELLSGSTINFERQDDLRATDFNNTKYEYGLGHEGVDTKEPIKQLFSALPFCLSPTQAVEGWVRFMAKDINPDNLKDKSFRLRVVDSLGTEHQISKAAVGKARKGEIGLRRISG